jgi:hypothetical protein
MHLSAAGGKEPAIEDEHRRFVRGEFANIAGSAKWAMIWCLSLRSRSVSSLPLSCTAHITKQRSPKPASTRTSPTRSLLGCRNVLLISATFAVDELAPENGFWTDSP